MNTVAKIDLVPIRPNEFRNTANEMKLLRWRSALLWRTFLTTAVVAVVLRGFIDFCRPSGNCGLFGQGGLIMFDVNSAHPTYSVPDLLAMIFLGIIGGVLGSLYNHFIDKVLRMYNTINKYVLYIMTTFFLFFDTYMCL